ncbi:MAG TPA: sugar transferase [candidate division Zixibacteria bacterium]|nr:sugar transferase [candidate division Zixibacteria bacterium]
MANELHNNTDISAHDGVAIQAANPGLGTARGIEVGWNSASSVSSVSLWNQLQFYYGEYFKGILFVLASTIFILAVPTMLMKRESAMSYVFRITKRFVDIAGALIGLLLTLPVFIVLPILIKLDSRGPVFYSQARVGENRRKHSRRYCQKTDLSEDRRNRDRRRSDAGGRVFKVMKFRTMVNNAEKASGPVWATKNDPRITRLGRFMRKTRLDEIPQFINVLVGDMSLVGPRPERPKFVADLSQKIDDYERRLDVKPGLTGLAQVSCGYDTSIESVARKLEYDLKYIDEWSPWLDFKILCRTVIVVVTGRGAN